MVIAFIIYKIYNAHYRTELNEDEVLAFIPSTIARSTDTQGTTEGSKAANEIENILMNDDQGSRYSYVEITFGFLLHITHKCQL